MLGRFDDDDGTGSNNSADDLLSLFLPAAGGVGDAIAGFLLAAATDAAISTRCEERSSGMYVVLAGFSDSSHMLKVKTGSSSASLDR